jgi:hypothetical protein
MKLGGVTCAKERKENKENNNKKRSKNNKYPKLCLGNLIRTCLLKNNPESDTTNKDMSYRYMFLVGPKVFSFVVKGAKDIF